MAAAVSFVRALAGLVIHGQEKITLPFGLLQAALFFSLTMAWAALGDSAGVSECCRRGRVIPGLLKSCFEAAKYPSVLGKKSSEIPCFPLIRLSQEA